MALQTSITIRGFVGLHCGWAAAQFLEESNFPILIFRIIALENDAILPLAPCTALFEWLATLFPKDLK